MAFPDDRLPIRVELAFGADPAGDQAEWEWTDVTDDLHAQSIGISRGRSNEAAQVQPTSASLQLDNPDGRYTPDHPMSPYWPYIDQGVPGRLSVATSEAHYRQPATGPSTSNRLRTPSGAHLDVASDLDVRIEMTLDSIPARTADGTAQPQEIVGRYNTTGAANRSWRVTMLTTGVVEVMWSTTGGDFTYLQSSVPLPAVSGQRFALRVTLDVDNGAGGHTATFYTAPSLDGPWTQVGEPATGSGTTVIASPGDASLEIGDINTVNFYPAAGRYFGFELRDGIDGTVLANTPLAGQAPGTTAFTDDYGNAWNVTGNGTISDRHTRIIGQTDSWEPDWPYGDLSSATDDGESRVSVTISGLLRRLREGAKALDSTLRRRVPSGNPLAYWPMEEGRDATQAYSPVEGVRPLRTAGLSFATDDTLPGSDALPTVDNDGGSLSGRVPGATAGGWHVEMAYRLDALPATEQTMLTVQVSGSDAIAYAEVRVSTAGVRSSVYDADGNLIGTYLYTSPTALASFVGAWNRLQVYSAVSGATTYVAAQWVDISTGDWAWAASEYTGTPGRVTGVSGRWGPDFQDMALGHLAVWDTGGTVLSTSPLDLESGINVFDGADDGFAGESAGARMVRLCAEEGVSLQMAGYTVDTAAMGPQRPGTLMDLLRQCAEVDGGILGEQREHIGLRYRTRASLYNQTPALELDAGTNEITSPFRPVKDDQAVRNDVEVKREGGSSARVVDEASVAIRGRYEEQITLNPAGDDQLPDIAAWRVHLGTWPGMRYPSVSAELAIAPQVLEDWLRLDSGDLIQVTGLPPQHPAGAVTLMAQGYTETLSPTRWTVRANCSPGGPWTVGVVEDDVLGRADTAGSELADAAGEADTTLYVTTTQGPSWVTDPGEFPFDLRMGGEVVTATACSAAEDAPMRAAADNSTAGGASTSHVAPSVDAAGPGLLICLWQPWDTLTSYTLPGGMALGAETTATYTVTADATEALAAAGATGTRTATAAAADAWAAITVAAAGTPTVEEHLSGASGTGTTVALTTAAGTEAGWWLLAVQGCDSDAIPLAMPDDWTLLATSGTDGGSHPIAAAWAKRAAGGAETVEFAPGAGVDNHARLYVVSGATDLTAQAMTVVRSVNGVVKPHQAGADVRLAQPSVIAL